MNGSRANRTPRGSRNWQRPAGLLAALLLALGLLLALLLLGVLLGVVLLVLRECHGYAAERQRKAEHEAHQFLHLRFSYVTNCVVWGKDSRRDMNRPLTGN